MTTPLDWRGQTAVCLGTGPSLCQADVDQVRGLKVIAVNDAFKLAPWADVLYACDVRWWRWMVEAELQRKGPPYISEFRGRKFAMRPARQMPPHLGIEIVANAGRYGLATSLEQGLYNGHNSGYAAVNLAVLFGATRVLLLGYDMSGTHFFGRHPDGTVPPFDRCIPAFDTLRAPLAAAGVTVLNCTPRSRLRAFPIVPLGEALAPAPVELSV